MTEHDTLLLACRSPEERQYMRSVLRDSYYLLEAVNLQQMQMLLNQNEHCIAAIVADLAIWETWKDSSRQSPEDVVSRIPVIVIGREHTPEVLVRVLDRGAADMIGIDCDANAMLHRIDTVVQLYLYRRYLQAMVEEQAQKMRHSSEMMVDALSSIIEYRSAESGQHILRIRHFTKLLLEEVRRSCPEYCLTNEIISVIASASALHDIGKIGIPDSILMKPGSLTEQEREVMQTHAEIGCSILQGLTDVGDREYLRYAHNICLYHHERWDGGGYPRGLAGEDIPICAQVVGLADVYDALTSKRVYKEAYPFGKAVNMIVNGECGVFSPKLLECFKQIAGQFELLAKAYADGLTPQSEKFDIALPGPVEQDGTDSLNTVQAKFQCLLHYLNALVLELAVDRGHYHLRFNPYPEFGAIGNARDFTQLEQIVLERIVAPEDRLRMQKLIREGIGDFLQAGLRRQNYMFRFLGKDNVPQWYHLTLLRADVNQTENRSLAILCRKVEGGTEAPAEKRKKTEPVPQLWGDTLCCCNDRKLTLLRLGTDVGSLAGYEPGELAAEFGNELIRLVHPDDREMLRMTLREQFGRGNTAKAQFRVVDRKGRVLWIHGRAKLVTEQEGQELLYVVATDVTQAWDTCNSLSEKMHRYEIILAQTENVLFEWDMRTDTISFSDTWEQIFGFEPISGQVWHHLEHGSFFHPDDVEILGDAVSNLKNGSDYEMVEVRIATSKARYLWCRFRASAIRNDAGELEKICGIIININAEKKSSQALQDRAERDALTRLLNKYAGRKQAEEYFARHAQGVSCALLMIDLDNFKPINDRYGHLFGDTVLTQVAQLLKKMFRNQDIIARVGGDEFMVLMRGVTDPNLLQERCRQLTDLFRSTFGHLNEENPLSCSVGIALSPRHGNSYMELFQRADQALYHAKAQGKNCFAFYDADRETYHGGNRHTTDIDSDREPGLAENSLVQYAFRRLYAAKNVDASINEILDLVGRKMNVSRVYIFENSDDNRFCSNTYEWCNEGIQPEIRNLQNISYETDIEGYLDAYDETGIFYCPDIDMLPENIYNIVAPQGIKSLLHCAILDQGTFRGYIGFDECVTKRMWTKEQIDALTYLSEMLSVFLLKKREQEKALRQVSEFRSILDNQNAWIYIIDPDTCELKYLNAKARALAPEVEVGMPCYRVLMEENRRCSGCPCGDIFRKKTGCATLFSRRLDRQISAEATLIQWEGKTACLIVCREIS